LLPAWAAEEAVFGASRPPRRWCGRCRRRKAARVEDLHNAAAAVRAVIKTARVKGAAKDLFAALQAAAPSPPPTASEHKAES
jgi:hypothetical protein